MSWHFSQALVAEYLEASSSDGTQSPPWSSLPFAPDDSCSAKMKDTFHRSPFGTMFAPSTDAHSVALLTWFLEASRAKTYRPPERAPGFQENDLAFGSKWLGSFASLSPNGSWVKTAPFSFLEDSEPFSETWPRWGTMQNGECWGRMTPEPRTSEIGSGLLPTPRASEAAHAGRKTINHKGQTGLAEVVNNWPTPTACVYKGTSEASLTRKSGESRENDRLDHKILAMSLRDGGQQIRGTGLNPNWVEWLMGWPIGWTDSKPLETDKSLQPLPWHSSSFQITFRHKGN